MFRHSSKCVLPYAPGILPIVQSRINVANGKTRFTPGQPVSAGQYVRVIDTGEVVGNTALKFGGNETTWIQVFKDQSGNLITTYPIPAPQSGENL